MKIKVGDMVKVISGSYKGKEGKVLQILKSENRILVDKINIVKKHVKPNSSNETGGILETEAPIHISNVKLSKKEDKKQEKKNVKKTTKKESKKVGE